MTSITVRSSPTHRSPHRANPARWVCKPVTSSEEPVMTHEINRRQALRLLAGAAAAPLILRYSSALAGSTNTLPFGIASGDPWPDGFVIWTRLSSLPLYPGNRSEEHTSELQSH